MQDPYKTLVCFVEEKSTEEMLKIVIPRLLETSEMKYKKLIIRYKSFQGKQDLKKRVAERISEYQCPSACFLVLVDQDGEDCKKLKKCILQKIQAQGEQRNFIIRIACKELENFYLGDLKAVEKGLGLRNISKLQGKAKFRKPDHRGNAPQEIKELAGKKYSSKHSKVRDSLSIAPYLDLSGKNTSQSFNTLLSGIKRLLEHC